MFNSLSTLSGYDNKNNAEKSELIELRKLVSRLEKKVNYILKKSIYFSLIYYILIKLRNK
jgi:hypothetical protein